MTNLEGRVLRRRRAARRPRRACAATSRSSPSSPTGWAAAQFFDREPARGVRRAAPRERGRRRPTTPASATSASTPSSGVFWPCPDEPHPGHAAPVPRRLRDPGRARPLPRRAPPRRRRDRPTPSTRYRLTTGRAPRALPVRHADPAQPRRCSTPSPSRSSSIAPRPGRARSASPTASDVPLRTRRGGRGCGPGCHRTSAPTPSSPRSTGRAARRSTTSRTPPWTRPRGCPSSRPAPWPVDRRPRSDRPARPSAATAEDTADDDHPVPASCRASSRSRGTGWTSRALLDPSLSYTVPDGVTGQPLYFRGGNATDELVSLVLVLRRHADALLPDRREGRHARVAARRRGPPRRQHRRAARSRRPRALPAPSSSTSGWWRSDG